MKQRIRQCIVFLAMCIVFCLAGINAFAEENTVTVNVTGTYGQTEARSMCNMINDFRTGNDAWYWAEDNQEKRKCTDLKELDYDFELEQIAMQRAMEIAIYNSHTRPDGRECWTAYAGSEISRINKGENIAVGYTTAQKVFTGWQEIDDDYDGQGHRRNMLNSTYTAVGIGHVYYNGTHYWVQEFGNPTSSVAYSVANDKETSVQVNILKTNITASSIDLSKKEITLSYRTYAELPDVITQINTPRAWSATFKEWFPVDFTDIVWTSADENIASVADGKIVANSLGTVALTATVPALNKSTSVTVTVNPRSIADAQVTLSESRYDYDGTAKEPQVTVTLDGALLQVGTDYDITYNNNTNHGTATVTITGKGNYCGTVSEKFTINEASITQCSITGIPGESDTPPSYTGQKIQLNISIKQGKRLLEEGTDYTVLYSDNTNAGTASVKITGIGNYKDFQDYTFAISPIDLSKCEISDIEGLTYDGNAKKPVPSVTWNGTELKQNTDFSIDYENNINAGTATITLTGKRNFKGTRDVTFAIGQAELTDSMVPEITEQVYTGNPLEPSVTVQNLTLKKDYSVSYSNNTKAGQKTGVATVTGINNYKGTVTRNFTIKPVDLSDSKVVTIDFEESHVYTGSPITPEVTVSWNGQSLKKDTDYTVSYEKNVNASNQAAVIVTGTGNFAGTREEAFEITAIDLREAGAASIGPIAAQSYTGTGITPDVTVRYKGSELEEGDYSVSYGDNTAVGTATVTVKGEGNYQGSITTTFEITPINLAAATISEIADQPFTGSKITPELTVQWNDLPLNKGVDYAVEYKNNIAVGTASVTLTGAGNYTGTVTKSFQITQASIAGGGYTVSGIPEKAAYTGEEIKFSDIKVTRTVGDSEITLTKGMDYTVAYAKNINVSEDPAEVIITGAGNYKGSITKTFQITPVDISNYLVEGIAASYAYTGADITPAVTVKDQAGNILPDKNYSVSCTNNKDAGTATITVAGTGNYSGKIEKNFEITKITLSKDTVTIAPIAAMSYTGKEIMPVPVITWNNIRLVNDTDYRVSYQDNVTVGKNASVTVSGINNFTGSIDSITFEIVPASIDNCTVASIPNQTYTGSEITPALTVTNGSVP